MELREAYRQWENQETSQGPDPVAYLQVVFTFVSEQGDPPFKQNLTQNSMYREMNGWRSGQRTNMARLPWTLTSSSRGISKGSGGHSEPMIQSEELRSRHMKCLPQNPMPRSRRLHPPPPVSVHVWDGWPQKPRMSRLTAIYPRTAPPTPQV